MPLFKGNDTDLTTKILKDGAGSPITTGLVEAEVLTEDGATVLLAKGAMAHSAGGVWKRRVEGPTITAWAVPSGHAKTRVTVGDPVDATFVRLDEVVDRRA